MIVKTSTKGRTLLNQCQLCDRKTFDLNRALCVDLRILVQMIQENVRLKAEIVKF